MADGLDVEFRAIRCTRRRWAVIGGKTETVCGTACRQPDGSWKSIN